MDRATDPVDLSLFASRLVAVCDEMGAVLRRAAFSPNIRERLDFSCAVFSPDGRLVAQAAHIPVHLGSMAYAMKELVQDRNWVPGMQLMLNDPFMGGTHLPDVTLVMPVFTGARLVGFVANRAHHADIGADTPGSMPLSTHIDQEGVLIPPMTLREGLALLTGALSRPQRTLGDLAAQEAANRAGAARLADLAVRTDLASAMEALDAYAARLAASALAGLPHGRFHARDLLDDDGAGQRDLPVSVTISIRPGGITVDFDGTASQCSGNLNCPLPVTAAAVWYAFRCLMPDNIPAAQGAFDRIDIRAEPGSLVNAQAPAAVAAGNVETSQRIVDVVLAALAQAIPDRIPAAAQGTMNNLALGARGPGGSWDYYETIAGGMGAHARGAGLSAVQVHMTNTLNTPAEALEIELPVRVRCHAIRRGSGGTGLHAGGDGMERELEALVPMTATVISERRTHAPWGLAGGTAGSPGENRLNGEQVSGKCMLEIRPGDRLRIATPGGGGWGKP